MTRGVQGIPTANAISQNARNEILTSMYTLRQELNQFKDERGRKVGEVLEGIKLIGKMHLGAAFEDDSHGVNKYDGLFDVDMGGTRVTKEVLRHCIRAGNSNQLLDRVEVSKPVPIKSKTGELTGELADIFIYDDEGNKIPLAQRRIRSKQGETGKLSTTYQWSRDMQECFKGNQKLVKYL